MQIIWEYSVGNHAEISDQVVGINSCRKVLYGKSNKEEEKRITKRQENYHYSYKKLAWMSTHEYKKSMWTNANGMDKKACERTNGTDFEIENGGIREQKFPANQN